MWVYKPIIFTFKYFLLKKVNLQSTKKSLAIKDYLCELFLG